MKLEQQIIGSCLTFEAAFDQAIDKLQPRHFKLYGPVFAALKQAFEKGIDHDNILFEVEHILGDKAESYNLFKLVDQGKPSIEAKISDLKAQHIKFEAKKIANELYEVEESEDSQEEILQAIQRLSDLISGEGKEVQSMSDVMSETLELVEQLKSGEQLGFESGLDIDKTTKGFQTGQFYLLAARPSMGKTALAIQIAKKVAKQAPVGFLSLETTNKSLGLRYLINQSRMSGDKVRGGYINDSDMKQLLSSASELAELPIFFDDTANITASGIRAKVNSMKRKYDIEFLVIDYVQLMQGTGNTREQEVAGVSRTCVQVAKDFDISVLGLAQLSRKNETRGGDKRPILSDLRESGQLEQDAFCVMMLHRPEYYGISNYPSGEPTDGVAEIIIAKHKDGPTGIQELHFDKKSMRFENMVKENATAMDYFS